MKKIVLFIMCVLLLPKFLLGQYQIQTNEELKGFNAIPKEQVFIHFNDNLLLSGEYLYYKFYNLNTENNTPSKISKIGYVVLLGEDDTLVFQHKINLVNGNGQGDFFIPATIQTGHYKLIGFTQWMRNQKESSFFEADLVIVNPYKTLPKVTNTLLCEEITHSKSDSLADFSTSKVKNQHLQIELAQRTFGKRQLVQFNIQEITNQELNNVSISVRKKDSITIPFQKRKAMHTETNSISNDAQELKRNDSIYLPELRGELISGRLISKTSKQPVIHKNISVSLAGKNGNTKISRSNENGAVYFNLVGGHRNDELIFSLLEDHEEDLEIKIDSKVLNTNAFDFKEIFIPTHLNELFEQRNIYNQIENAFFEQKSDSIIATQHITPAYNDFQELYNLDDYTRFPTLKETIIEIIEDVLVKKRKGKNSIQIRGKDLFFIDSNDVPLVLIDHILMEDTSPLFDFDVRQIDRIGISRSEFYMGSKKYQGIFSIATKEGDYAANISSKKSLIHKIAGPIVVKKYHEQNYANHSKNITHAADFRRQLLWLPNAKINEFATFQFYASDYAGTYEISVEGFSENGTPLSLLESITIK